MRGSLSGVCRLKTPVRQRLKFPPVFALTFPPLPLGAGMLSRCPIDWPRRAWPRASVSRGGWGSQTGGVGSRGLLPLWPRCNFPGLVSWRFISGLLSQQAGAMQSAEARERPIRGVTSLDNAEEQLARLSCSSSVRTTSQGVRLQRFGTPRRSSPRCLGIF